MMMWDEVVVAVVIRLSGLNDSINSVNSLVIVVSQAEPPAEAHHLHKFQSERAKLPANYEGGQEEI